MIILGIDPGYADAGFGVIESRGGRDRVLAYGSIQTPKGTPHEERLQTLFHELGELIARFKPEIAGIEKLYFSKNVKTAISVAEARGVIRLALIEGGVHCREYDPGTVKVALCGDGKADKPAMQKMTQALLGLKSVPKPDDAADALAIALAVAHDQTRVHEERARGREV